jgi:DNA-binding transcriptional regulator YhcF (GntR family)
MFRIWISRSSSIPIREQLSAQLLFGILSHRFQPSERLPSVRDLARCIKVHSNTVSAAYRDLVARGWLKRKAGSGVFVCDLKTDANRGPVDAFVHAWIEESRSRGFSFAELSAAFEKAAKELSEPQSRPLLVVHPDRELARILAAEIEEATGFAIASSGMQNPLEPHFFLTTASAVGSVSAFPHDVIQLKSVDETVRGIPRPTGPSLIAIVSRSESILKWASLLTPVLGLTGSDLIARNPAHPKWQEGLAACDLIVADILAIRELPKSIKSPMTLRLIADAYLPKARELVTAEKP